MQHLVSKYAGLVTPTELKEGEARMRDALLATQTRRQGLNQQEKEKLTTQRPPLTRSGSSGSSGSGGVFRRNISSPSKDYKKKETSPYNTNASASHLEFSLLSQVSFNN
jgi:hypothetical protein